MTYIKLKHIIIILCLYSFSDAIFAYAEDNDVQTLNHRLKQKLNLDVSHKYTGKPRIEEDLDSKVNSADHFNSIKKDKKLAISLKRDKVFKKIGSTSNLAQNDQSVRSRAFKEVTVPLGGNNSMKNINIGLNLDLATE